MTCTQEESGGSTASSGGNAQDATFQTPMPLTTYNGIAEGSGGSTASSGGNAQDGTNKEIMAQLRMIITQNHLLRAITSDTQERLRKLEEKLESVGKRQPTEMSFFSKFSYLEFPINSLEHKKNFEIILEEKQNFEDAVKEISKFGGKNNYDFIKRAMTTLLSNEMALKFSWFRRKGKLIFNTSIIAKLVICAAEKTQIEGCMKTSEGHIQLWLKRAYDWQHAQQKKF